MDISRSIMIYIETLNDKPIPFKNEYYLSSFIRERLSNSPFFYEDNIHDSNQSTPYTISRIFPLDDDKRFEDDVGIFTEDYSFIFRSLNNDIMKVIRGSLGINPRVKLEDSIGNVKKLNTLNEPQFDNEINFKARSPILLKTPSDLETDNKYLEPTDDKYEEILASNMLETYKRYSCESVGNEVNVKINEYDKTHVRITSKEKITAPAYLLEGKIEASSDILEVAYYGGLGSLTGMGLGCWDVVE